MEKVNRGIIRPTDAMKELGLKKGTYYILNAIANHAYEGYNVPIMVTIPEAIKLTRVTDYALRSLIEAEKIKAFRSGKGRYGKWLINLKSLCDYLSDPS